MEGILADSYFEYCLRLVTVDGGNNGPAKKCWSSGDFCHLGVHCCTRHALDDVTRSDEKVKRTTESGIGERFLILQDWSR